MTRFDWFAREVAEKLLKLFGAIRVHIRIEYADGNSINFVAPEADWKEVAREAVSR